MNNLPLYFQTAHAIPTPLSTTFTWISTAGGKRCEHGYLPFMLYLDAIFILFHVSHVFHVFMLPALEPCIFEKLFLEKKSRDSNTTRAGGWK